MPDSIPDDISSPTRLRASSLATCTSKSWVGARRPIRAQRGKRIFAQRRD
jgi:hypothetical protein